MRKRTKVSLWQSTTTGSLVTPAQHQRASAPHTRSEHECERVLEVALERRQPPRTNRAINCPVVRAKGNLQDLRNLETTLLLGRGEESRLCRTDSKNT